MNIHDFYIKRCIQIAKNGLGNTYPNPMVGCVIVADNKVIGEGFTSPAGQNHAEVNAVQSVKDKALLKKATLYVTLEPCSHFGKTPPCADLIVKNKIPNVVVGVLDSNEKVAGRGIRKLTEAGCKVTVGILEDACKESNKRFFTFHEKRRPYIILKWAQTANGFIAPSKDNSPEDRKPIWITNKFSRQLVHKWRSEEQAILVGTNTVITDNPKLNTRDWQGNSPIRVVLDRQLRIPKDSFVWEGSQKTIFLVGQKTKTEDDSSENIVFENIDFNKNVAQQICDVLFKHEIQSLIVEGGSKTLQTFIDENLWDEARVFEGKTNFENGTQAPVLKHPSQSEENITGDLLKTYKND
ncbi:bifunctional diaminohydroxyphosphoribosylaminopyrimidine deaminase/5-amino-6-(5-phosphoribosylamino)uracil reductase RibD [Galbibacter sp. EGI 63066]|uniref:bifunctional diaminohydroxyphosphoribosylaminopyrimidine deaminase/5-amino-6-(5-phosphoribosylamino)uracil reductase RibD n=1 Tax=Galbibacter sp. EGI 63066 TaxID=2993559 RepID=UPI0022494CED|nr:bifunctional diaminohydroxyphosphoribosylaminopyrimidine deaminase/5-amino-6-(5-phosphoribosylamino)uracil reductase RibD [Galbibacter sp. EGI 63066]MCX2681353.1 bifunctional diaminohydroxyphosphoribosylaminopyrimidine deaminase/5-amino-6-(5-phosphoribosylamino)uracil reductase RibD [Galbibacter sp. EGI 63066]